MADIKVIPYEPAHFLRVRTASEYFAVLHELYDFKSPENLAYYYLRGPAYTMLANSEIVGCGGILRLWKGVGDAWMLATPLIQKYPKSALCITKVYLDRIIEALHFVRIQAVVKQDFWMAHNFIRRLGFQGEGLMPKYFGGQDFVRYALISGQEE